MVVGPTLSVRVSYLFSRSGERMWPRHVTGQIHGEMLPFAGCGRPPPSGELGRSSGRRCVVFLELRTWVSFCDWSSVASGRVTRGGPIPSPAVSPAVRTRARGVPVSWPQPPVLLWPPGTCRSAQPVRWDVYHSGPKTSELGHLSTPLEKQFVSLRISGYVWLFLFLTFPANLLL